MADNSNPTPISLGRFLRTARTEAGLSIRELARRAGASYTYLSRVESGERGMPKPELLQRLAKELNVNPAELLAYVGIEPTAPEPKMYFRRYMGLSAHEADILYELAEDIKAKRKDTDDEEINEEGHD